MKIIKTARLADGEIQFLGRYDNQFTAQIHEDLVVLQEALRSAESSLSGRFSVSQACLLCDVLNGHLFSPQFFASLPVLLAAEVEDGCRLDALDKKWQVDGRELVAACTALSPWEAYAVHHLARLFWSGPYRDSDVRKIVAQLFRCASADEGITT